MPPAMLRIGCTVTCGASLGMDRYRASRSRSRGLYLFRNCPDEAHQLARDRGRDHRRQLSGAGERAVAPAQPLLRLPCDVTDRFGPTLLAQQLFAADPCRKAIAPCRLDQHPSRRAVTGLGDPTLAACAAAGVFGWHQAKIGHEL